MLRKSRRRVATGDLRRAGRRRSGSRVAGTKDGSQDDARHDGAGRSRRYDGSRRKHAERHGNDSRHDGAYAARCGVDDQWRFAAGRPCACAASHPWIAAAATCSTCFNDTAWWHPMHLHGHVFRVLSRDGRPSAHREWLDTVLMAPGERAEIAFVADNPGDWMFHCHILEHQKAGDDGLISGGVSRRLSAIGAHEPGPTNGYRKAALPS
jgi:Multicopper oxidase